MKQLIKVQEVEEEGFLALMNKEILVFAYNYIYTGTLVGVNDTFIKLEGARLVYDIGELGGKLVFETWPFKYSEPTEKAIPRKVWYIQQSAIESFGE